MKVKCTQCGKMFEVPNSQAQRALKCVCKNIFLAVPIMEEIPQKKTTPETSPAPPEAKPPSLFDQIASEPVEEETEEGLEEYVQFLKQSVAQKGGGDAKTMPPREIPTFESIELAEQQPALIEPPELPVEEARTDPIAVAAVEDNRAAFESARQGKTPRISYRPPPKIPSVNHFSRQNIIIASASLIAVTLFFTFFFASPKKEEPPMDPYLTKLLTPQVYIKTTTPEIELPRVDPQKQKQLQSEVNKVVHASAKVSSPLLEKMRSAAFRGDFENIVRLGSAQAHMGPEERALFLEALFERAGERIQRHDELTRQLESEKKALSDSSASPFLRTTAFAILKNPSPSRNIHQAIDILKSLGMSRSWDPFVFAYLGMGYELLERLDMAHHAWDQALTLQSDYVWVLEISMANYRSEKKYQKAMELAEHLSRLPGEEVNGLRKQAEIAELRNDFNAAADYYRKAIKIKDAAELRLILGDILAETNQEGALREYYAALDVHPTANERRDLQIKIGRIECQSKNYSAASQAFKKAWAEDPRSIRIATEKAQCELSAGTFKLALATLERALKIDPNSFQLWQDYGLALYHEDKQRAALAALKRALEIRPTDQAHYRIAQVLVSLSKREDAGIHLKKALQLNPKNREAKALLNSLN